jgi:hypothetical protein
LQREAQHGFQSGCSDVKTIRDPGGVFRVDNVGYGINHINVAAADHQ